MSESDYAAVFNSAPGPHDPFVTLVLRLSRVALVIEAAERTARSAEAPPVLRRAIDELKTAVYANCCDAGETTPRADPDMEKNP